MDIAELADPEAVWKAVEGDPSDLIALLRSDKYITRRTREALADYLAGSLKPICLPKGRPSKSNVSAFLYRLCNGHDLTTQIGLAGFRYDQLRRFIRRKGWHIGHPNWSERLKESIAKRHDIELERFINYLARSRPLPTFKPFGADYVKRRRVEIAREIRRAKKIGFG